MDTENKSKLIYFAFKIYVNSSLWSLSSSNDEFPVPGQEKFGTWNYEEHVELDSEPILLYGARQDAIPARV